jgi:hypothetical protein
MYISHFFCFSNYVHTSARGTTNKFVALPRDDAALDLHVAAATTQHKQRASNSLAAIIGQQQSNERSCRSKVAGIGEELDNRAEIACNESVVGPASSQARAFPFMADHHLLGLEANS